MSCVRRALGALVVLVCGAWNAPVARAQAVAAFSNTAPIVINDNANATPFPSTITVSGLTGVVVKIRVTLSQVSHTFGQDITVWLVGPSNQAIVLLGRAAGKLTSTTLEFDDCAPRAFAGGSNAAMSPGRYRPGSYQSVQSIQVPAPTGSTLFPVSTLAALNATGAASNGTWALYVKDNASTASGTIAGGWRLTFFTQPAPPIATAGSIQSPSCGRPDYDGDGRSDVAVYRPATGQWFILQSSTKTGLLVSWGAGESTGLGDIAAPGDYDGDGQTDIAVYRQTTGTWLIRYSMGGSGSIDFGAPSASGLGDTPVPGDYDGDGVTDLAVYRAATGQWFVRNSNGTGNTVSLWGAPSLGDYPARR